MGSHSGDHKDRSRPPPPPPFAFLHFNVLRTPQPHPHHLCICAVGGAIPKSKRLSCFAVAEDDPRSVDLEGTVSEDYVKPKAPSVSMAKAGRYDQTLPWRAAKGKDSAGPIYHPDTRALHKRAAAACIPTQRRDWPTALKTEMYARLDAPQRRGR